MARREPVETAEFAAMVGRMVTALGRRVADGDPADLADMLALASRFDAEVASAVRRMREQHGYSWADVGEAAGVTRQAAQQRWGK